MKIIKNYLLLITLLYASSCLPLMYRSDQQIKAGVKNIPTSRRLSDFNYSSASVMPFYEENGIRYVILSREEWGRDAGTYDDFGGSRDRGEGHPVITAGREFWEEAILDKTIGLTLPQALAYIDISRPYTEYIIANITPKGAKHVTYITDFNNYKEYFFKNFYAARSRAHKHENREKDRIAIVAWNDLKQAIQKQKHYKDPVYVSALVIDPKTKKQIPEKILLRPYLVIKLHGFFWRMPYTQGRNEKIQFYEPKNEEFTRAWKATYRDRTQEELKELADDLHAIYKKVGIDFAYYIFNSGTTLGYVHAEQYVKAIEQDQSVLEKEIEKCSGFFNYFSRRRLKQRYENGKKILEQLYGLRRTAYW